MAERKKLDEEIDPAQLLKLRLCVARFGEMDLAGWWNTKGVLASIGKSAYSRGFPMTHYFAQGRVACAVAAARCREVFSPPGCATLWSLPPEIDDRIQSSWQQWCRDAESWEPFFLRLTSMGGEDLIVELSKLSLIDDRIVERAGALRRSAEGRGVALPGHGRPDRGTLMLLAAAFSRGERGKLSVPYIRSED